MDYVEEAKQRRRSFADARHRPRYHFLPPANWMNDPNGVIQWRGRYHLFYQFNPYGPMWGQIHWGHAVSGDLIHWEDQPIALTPTPGGPDEEGCWSGCAVDHDDVPTIFYTGIRGEHSLAQSQVTCMAVGSDDLISWHKHPGNPVLTPPTDLDLIGFRDPSVWHEDGVWYQLIGAGIREVGGAALLYRSDDLLEWEYLGPLLNSSQHDPAFWTGSIWECPQLLSFGHQRVLIFGVWDDGTHYSVAMTGSYQNHRFTPERVGKLDAGDRHFYAAQALTDDHGRHLMWGWIQEAGPEDVQSAAGWSGVMSLPRQLTMAPDGTLLITSPKELEGLRDVHTRFENLMLTSTQKLGEGVQLELKAELEPSGAECGLVVFCSPDGVEQTRIFYDPTRKKLGVDRGCSGLQANTHPKVQEGDFELLGGESLKLHIFLDHSVVEVFANDRFCVTSRVYPSRADSTGVHAFGTGAQVKTLDSWTLRPIW